MGDHVERYLVKLKDKDKRKKRYKRTNLKKNIGKRTGQTFPSVAGLEDISGLFQSISSDSSEYSVKGNTPLHSTLKPVLYGKPESPPNYHDSDSDDETEAIVNSSKVAEDSSATESQKRVTEDDMHVTTFVDQGTQWENTSSVQKNASRGKDTTESEAQSAQDDRATVKKCTSNGVSSEESSGKSKIAPQPAALSVSSQDENDSSTPREKRDILTKYTEMIESAKLKSVVKEGTGTGISVDKAGLTPKNSQQNLLRRRLSFKASSQEEGSPRPTVTLSRKEPTPFTSFELDSISVDQNEVIIEADDPHAKEKVGLDFPTPTTTNLSLLKRRPSSNKYRKSDKMKSSSKSTRKHQTSSTKSRNSEIKKGKERKRSSSRRRLSSPASSSATSSTTKHQTSPLKPKNIHPQVTEDKERKRSSSRQRLFQTAHSATGSANEKSTSRRPKPNSSKSLNFRNVGLGENTKSLVRYSISSDESDEEYSPFFATSSRRKSNRRSTLPKKQSRSGEENESQTMKTSTQRRTPSSNIKPSHGRDPGAVQSDQAEEEIDTSSRKTQKSTKQNPSRRTNTGPVNNKQEESGIDTAKNKSRDIESGWGSRYNGRQISTRPDLFSDSEQVMTMGRNSLVENDMSRAVPGFFSEDDMLTTRSRKSLHQNTFVGNDVVVPSFNKAQGDTGSARRRRTSFFKSLAEDDLIRSFYEPTKNLANGRKESTKSKDPVDGPKSTSAVKQKLFGLTPRSISKPQGAISESDTDDSSDHTRNIRPRKKRSSIKIAQTTTPGNRQKDDDLRRRVRELYAQISSDSEFEEETLIEKASVRKRGRPPKREGQEKSKNYIEKPKPSSGGKNNFDISLVRKRGRPLRNKQREKSKDHTKKPKPSSGSKNNNEAIFSDAPASKSTTDDDKRRSNKSKPKPTMEGPTSAGLSDWLKSRGDPLRSSRVVLTPLTTRPDNLPDVSRSAFIERRSRRIDPASEAASTDFAAQESDVDHPPLPNVDESAINTSVNPRRSVKSNKFGPPASTPRRVVQRLTVKDIQQHDSWDEKTLDRDLPHFMLGPHSQKPRTDLSSHVPSGHATEIINSESEDSRIQDWIMPTVPRKKLTRNRSKKQSKANSVPASSTDAASTEARASSESDRDHEPERSTAAQGHSSTVFNSTRKRNVHAPSASEIPRKSPKKTTKGRTRDPSQKPETKTKRQKKEGKVSSRADERSRLHKGRRRKKPTRAEVKKLLQSTNLEFLHEKELDILIPEEDTTGLRRSKRVRTSRPLGTGERLVYSERDKNGDRKLLGFQTRTGFVPIDRTKTQGEVIHVEPPSPSPKKTRMRKKGNESRKHQSKKANASKDNLSKNERAKKDVSRVEASKSKRADSSSESSGGSTSWFDGMEPTGAVDCEPGTSKQNQTDPAEKTLQLIDPDTNNFVNVDISSVVADQNGTDDTLKNCADQYGVWITKGISIDGETAQGKIIIQPKKSKKERVVQNSTMHFSIDRGRIVVKMGGRSIPLNRGAYFTVWSRNSYSLYNPSNRTRAELVYTMVRRRPKNK